MTLLLASMPAQVFASNPQSEGSGLLSANSASHSDATPEEAIGSGGFTFSALRGTVADSNGQGLSGVSIYIYNPDASCVLSECITDENGHWESAENEVIPGDNYKLVFHKTGYALEPNYMECVAESEPTTVGTVTATEITGYICKPEDYKFSISSNNTATITGYTGSDTRLRLPDELNGCPVVSIGKYAFDKKTTIEAIAFSNSITSIGACAFNQCTKLTFVEFPEALTSIGQNAFWHCSSLSTVELPNSVRKIVTSAFESCSNLRRINYSTGLSSVGISAFAGCRNLECFIVPEGVTSLAGWAFASASSLKAISLPSTLTSIGKAAFMNCTGIKAIELPETLTYIGQSAFQRCTGLTFLEIPNSVRTLGIDAFSGCANLSSINIPTSWAKGNNSGIFSGCRSLESIVVPEGITALPNFAFSGAQYLKSISLPSTLTSIGACAFSGCSSLESLLIPENVTNIKQQAFEKCAALRSVVVLSKNCSIGQGILKSSPNAVLYCYDQSNTQKYAIMHGLPFQLLEELEPQDSAQGSNQTRAKFYTSSALTAVNTSIPMTLEYEIPEELFASMESPRITITFSPNLVLTENSVAFGDVSSQYGASIRKKIFHENYNQLLTLNITEPVGKIRFLAKPLEVGRMAAFAELSYTSQKQKYTEAIGHITVDLPLLKLKAPSRTSELEFEVGGVTRPSAVVDLSIDGGSTVTATADKDGLFWVTLAFPENPVSNTCYTVNARFQEDPSVATCVEVCYQADYPTLTQFDMYRYASAGNECYLDLLHLRESAFTGLLNPKRPLKFVLRFTNPERLEDVYVTSTKSGVTKKMQAYPTDVPGEFVAEGWFEGTDSTSSYLPSALNVQFSLKPSADSVGEIKPEDLPEDLKQAHTEVITNTDTDYEATITLPDDAQINLEAHTVSINDLRQMFPDWTPPEGVDDPTEVVSSLFAYLKETYGNAAITNYEPGSKSDQYFFFLAGSNPGTLFYGGSGSSVGGSGSSVGGSGSSVGGSNGSGGNGKSQDSVTGVTWNIGKESVQTIYLNFMASRFWDRLSDSAILDDLLGIPGGTASGAVGLLEFGLSYYGAIKEYYQYENLIRQKGTNLEQLRQYNRMLLTTRLTTSLLSLAIAVSTPWSVGVACGLLITALMKILESELLNKALGGDGLHLNWAICPKGYVYDIDTGARIEGVTTTAYWIPCVETDPAFWENKPDESDYGFYWDASEYAQENPLLTDSQGCYAWDVPEGWWRVKYEKDGYETTWSEWVPVPPIQTNVNVGMKAVERSACDDAQSIMICNPAVIWEMLCSISRQVLAVTKP